MIAVASANTRQNTCILFQMYEPISMLQVEEHGCTARVLIVLSFIHPTCHLLYHLRSFIERNTILDLNRESNHV